MQIGLSTGAAFPFAKTKLKQMKEIFAFKGEVAGIEVIFPRPIDLINFNPKGRLAGYIKEFDFFSIHYPFPRNIGLSKISEKKLLTKINSINKVLPVKHSVLHPGSVKEWKNFQTSEIDFLIENQCYGKNRQWYTPKAMAKLLKKTNLKMCLDLNHAMGWGIPPEKFLPLRKSIAQVHVNATETFGSESHCFLSQSSPKAVKLAVNALKKLKHAVWMIEPKSLGKPKKKIQRELALLKAL